LALWAKKQPFLGSRKKNRKVRQKKIALPQRKSPNYGGSASEAFFFFSFSFIFQLLVVEVGFEKISSFIASSRRVLVIARKPTWAEYQAMVKVTGLGVVVIAILAFVVYLIFAFAPLR
jgi:protein transport protein SEC61 subunit gamma-like protein